MSNPIHISDPKAFARRLKKARDASGLSQAQLGFEGCAPAYISMIERGERIPSLQVIQELAKRIGVSAEWLVTGDEAQDWTRVARQIVSEHREGVEIPVDLIDQLDLLSMPSWYQEWLSWVTKGSEKPRPEGVPVRIPKWIREHREQHERAQAREERFG